MKRVVAEDSRAHTITAVAAKAVSRIEIESASTGSPARQAYRMLHLGFAATLLIVGALWSIIANLLIAGTYYYKNAECRTPLGCG